MVKEGKDNVNPLHELELQKIPSKYFRLMMKGTKEEEEQEGSSATSQYIEVFPITGDKVEECTLKLEFRSKLDDKLEAECVRLFLDNMKEEYERSSWGLDMDEKLREFRHEDARFLILRNSECGGMNAFSHIRFEEDGILFVWEIQVEACCRGLGQGGLLMAIIHSLAISKNKTKIMLTVFNSNSNAVRFYRKLGFFEDMEDKNSQPDDRDYKMMAKLLPRRSKRRKI